MPDIESQSYGTVIPDAQQGARNQLWAAGSVSTYMESLWLRGMDVLQRNKEADDEYSQKSREGAQPSQESKKGHVGLVSEQDSDP